jgi:hypothetical protein
MSPKTTSATASKQRSERLSAHLSAAEQLDGALPGCFATGPASQAFGSGAILALAGRAAHLEAVGQPS